MSNKFKNDNWLKAQNSKPEASKTIVETLVTSTTEANEMAILSSENKASENIPAEPTAKVVPEVTNAPSTAKAPEADNSVKAEPIAARPELATMSAKHAPNSAVPKASVSKETDLACLSHLTNCTDEQKLVLLKAITGTLIKPEEISAAAIRTHDIHLVMRGGRPQFLNR